jgi:hypothetical protein
MDTPQVLLDHHLKTLRLPTFLREYDGCQHARIVRSDHGVCFLSLPARGVQF